MNAAAGQAPICVLPLPPLFVLLCLPASLRTAAALRQTVHESPQT
jgi:hypothetical protein